MSATSVPGGSTAVRKKTLYPFLPSRLQRGAFLLWLKRTHAWTGLFGALMFLVLGISGFLLNHRATMKIDTGAPVEVSSFETVIGADRFADRKAFAAWVKEEYDIALDPSPERRGRGDDSEVSFGGRRERPAERWELRFVGPNARIEASYLPKAGLLQMKRTEGNVLGLLKKLHKGHGVGVAFILLADAVAGALILMSLSGILLWSKLHGPRLAALGIFGGAFVWLFLAVSPNWV